MTDLPASTMQTSSWHLLATRRFLPLFLTQFLGAFNDNLYKMAMIVLITFRLAQETAMSEAVLANIAAALFILPFFLGSYLAGQLADKYEKSRQIRWIKAWEIILMMLGAYGFYTGNIWVLMIILFAMGLQSTFFGPIKYSILPQILSDEELVAGNGLIEAATFLSILLGSSAGGLLVLSDGGIFWTSTATICCAVVGFIISLFIPAVPCTAPDLQIKYNPITETKAQIKVVRQNPIVFQSVIGISWLWLYGSVFLAQIPPLVKTTLMGDEQTVTLLLGIFSIGIGIGSIICAKLLKGQISARLVKSSLISVTIAGCLFVLTVHFLTGSPHHEMLTITQFLATSAALPIIITLLWHTVSSGIYVVPLYALMQQHSPPENRSRVIASLNVVNSGFIVFGAVCALAILLLGGNSLLVLLIVTLANIIFLPRLKLLIKSKL